MNTRQITQEYRMNQWVEVVRECLESGQTVTPAMLLSITKKPFAIEDIIYFK